MTEPIIQYLLHVAYSTILFSKVLWCTFQMSGEGVEGEVDETEVPMSQMIKTTHYCCE